MAVIQPAGTSGDAMSDGARTSHVDGARPSPTQANWPTGGGAVVVEVEVEVLVLVEVLVVVELLVVELLVVVLVLVVGGTMAVVVDVVVVGVGTRRLIPAGASVAGEVDLVDPAHPVATRTRVMTGNVTGLSSRSATRGRDASSAARPLIPGNLRSSNRSIDTLCLNRRAQSRQSAVSRGSRRSRPS